MSKHFLSQLAHVEILKHAAASVQMSNDRQHSMPIESPEQVAEKIVEAIRTQAAEVSCLLVQILISSIMLHQSPGIGIRVYLDEHVTKRSTA